MKYKLRKIQLLEAKINNFLENVLIEKVDNDILRDMSSFGLSKNDIDNEGYVTLYHGGVNLPNKLKKDDIFFMTPSQHEAQDYANMRNGSVYTLKVKPEDVNWNQGSYEVEYTKGGIIKDGYIIPPVKKNTYKPQDKSITYKNIAIGDILSKTGYKVLDIVIHNNQNSKGSAQMLLDTKNGQPMWYDAETVFEYENSK